jgi:hypothetical protein
MCKLFFKRGGLLVAGLILVGCASAPPASGQMADGPIAAPPPGWAAFCAVHQGDPSCSP